MGIVTLSLSQPNCDAWRVTLKGNVEVYPCDTEMAQRRALLGKELPSQRQEPALDTYRGETSQATGIVPLSHFPVRISGLMLIVANGNILYYLLASVSVSP